MLKRRLFGAVLSCLVLVSPAFAADSFDNGRLDSSWFGRGVEFMETDQIDYFWIKDGVELKDRNFHFKEWSEPEFIGPKAAERDEKDRRLARQMAADMHNSFADIWNGVGLASSTDSGDVIVEGRVVDCSTGNRAAKVLVGLGAGAGSTVIDVRFKDASSGEVIAGFHHRVVSGTSWSTTGSKFFKWVKKSGKELSGGFEAAYRKGDPQKD